MKVTNITFTGQQRVSRYVEAMVSLIHNLSRNRINANTMLDNGVVRLVLQAMKENTRSSTIAEHCCATLYYLMQHAESTPSTEMANEISAVVKESIKAFAMYRYSDFFVHACHVNTHILLFILSLT